MSTVSNKVLVGGKPGTFSWDPESLAVAAKFTDSLGAEYTQNLDTGNFFKSDGTWLGATDQLTVKQAFGQSANLELGDPELRKKLDKYADGLNLFENPGGSSAGNSADKASQGLQEKPQPAIPPRQIPVARKRYGNLKYPLTLDGIDYVTIRQYAYEPLSAIGAVSGRERRADRRHKESIGSVTLPIPNQLADTNACSWNQSEFNDLQMGGLQAGARIMNSGNFFGAIQSEVENGLNALGNNTQGGKQAIQAFLLGGLPGINKRPNEILGRFNGQMLNPNLELIFNGPTLRQFQYSFRLTPRSDLESRMVRSIIRFFKQGMSVKETQTNLFLSSPNVFQPRFYNKQGRQHTFINVIKKCALRSFTVNYVPDNTYMTLPNSSMTAYDISMSFTELDPIVDMDYTELDGDNDNVIGF